MPKIFNLLAMYFSSKNLTVTQQNDLIIQLFVAVILVNIAVMITSFVGSIIIKNKDIDIEIKKQRAAERDKVYKTIYQHIIKINMSYQNDDYQKKKNLDGIAKVRNHMSINDICLNKCNIKIINEILDHMTTVNTESPASQNSRSFLKLIGKLKKEFHE